MAKVFEVYRSEWYGEPIGWTWEGYGDTSPAGAIADAVACGDSRVTLDDIASARFVDKHTGIEIDKYTGEKLEG